MGNVVEVVLEKNSQSAQLFCVVGHTSFYAKMDLAKLPAIGVKTQAPADSVSCNLQRPEMTCKRLLKILSNCAHIMQSITPITYPDQ